MLSSTSDNLVASELPLASTPPYPFFCTQTILSPYPITFLVNLTMLSRRTLSTRKSIVFFVNLTNFRRLSRDLIIDTTVQCSTTYSPSLHLPTFHNSSCHSSAGFCHSFNRLSDYRQYQVPPTSGECRHADYFKSTLSVRPPWSRWYD